MTVIPRPGARAAGCVLAPLAPVVGLLLACGGEAPKRRVATGPACPLPADRAVGPAVLEYVKQAVPTPQRYLVAVTTDSALPEAGLRALQSKGPTYMYPPDERLRAQVRKRMAEVGEYSSLLVAHHGTSAVSDTEAIVRLGGSYIGGKHDGRTTPPRTFRLACDSTGWRVRGSSEEAAT